MFDSIRMKLEVTFFFWLTCCQHVGIYFTTNVDYAAKVYAAAAEKDGILLILSWVFVGNIYPVTEIPTTAKSLTGKPVVVG